MSHYDVIVIGAGHNGLVNAAYLARAGRKVLVLERRHVVGGAAVTEEVFPGFRFSVCSYVVSLLRPEIIRELDLAAHGLRVEVHEPYLFAPLPDGRKVVTWSSPRRTAAQLERDWSRADAEGYAEWSARWERAADRVRTPARARPRRTLSRASSCFRPTRRGRRRRGRRRRGRRGGHRGRHGLERLGGWAGLRAALDPEMFNLW